MDSNRLGGVSSWELWKKSASRGFTLSDLPEGQTPPLPVSYGALDSPRLHHSNHHVISGLRRAAAFTFRPC
jgi:hypothetical protein